MSDYSADVRVWSPYLEPVLPAELTDAQREALLASGKLAHHSPYYRVLAHDPNSLVARTKLYDLIMGGEDGLPLADREFAALWVSMINGCAYCVSVHARRLGALTDPTVAADACENVREKLQPRQAAIARLCEALTHGTQAPTREAIRGLREWGMSSVEVFDLVNVIAVFAWANRLMLGLGSSAPRERGAR